MKTSELERRLEELIGTELDIEISNMDSDLRTEDVLHSNGKARLRIILEGILNDLLCRTKVRSIHSQAKP